MNSKYRNWYFYATSEETLEVAPRYIGSIANAHFDIYDIHQDWMAISRVLKIRRIEVSNIELWPLGIHGHHEYSELV